MEINLNGKERAVEDGMTVMRLLGELDIDGPVAIELNRKICQRKDHESTVIQSGDVLEIVTIVGGG